MIQRYDIDENFCFGDTIDGCQAVMMEDRTGEYVLYADHVAALTASREITDAMVEAAAKVLALRAGKSWELWLPSTRAVFIGDARAALEAARAAGGAL